MELVQMDSGETTKYCHWWLIKGESWMTLYSRLKILLWYLLLLDIFSLSVLYHGVHSLVKESRNQLTHSFWLNINIRCCCVGQAKSQRIGYYTKDSCTPNWCLPMITFSRTNFTWLDHMQLIRYQTTEGPVLPISLFCRSLSCWVSSHMDKKKLLVHVSVPKNQLFRVSRSSQPKRTPFLLEIHPSTFVRTSICHFVIK